MKPTLVFVLGALGLLTLAKYQTAAARSQRAEQPAQERPRQRRRPRMGRRRFRHRTDEGLLDLNSATVFELQELDGIGEVLAGRIIENRPYATKIDLVGRRVIPDSAYEAIKRFVTVSHAA
jgi:hypothetical protein